jgi:hypothetical protein
MPANSVLMVDRKPQLIPCHMDNVDISQELLQRPAVGLIERESKEKPQCLSLPHLGSHTPNFYHVLSYCVLQK